MRRAAAAATWARLAPARRSYGASAPVTIWGANTDVGKTLVAAALATRMALHLDRQVLYIKPVQTGFPADEDARKVANAAAACGVRVRLVWGDHARDAATTALERAVGAPGVGVVPAPAGHEGEPNPQLVAHTRFAWHAPVSPHAAAATEGRPATASEVCDDAARAIAGHRAATAIIVETAGGPLSPSPDGSLQANALAPLARAGAHVLVADSRLGGISATLAAHEALRARGLAPCAVVLLQDEGQASLDNAGAIARHAASARVAVAPAIGTDEPLADWISRTTSAFDRLAEHVAAATPDDSGGCPYQSASAATQPAPDHALPAWHELGRAHVWLPYNQHLTSPPPLAVRAASGGRLLLHDDGHFDPRFRDPAFPGLVSVVDGVSSWWTACHGYAHPHIARAVGAQMARAPHVMLGGMLHEPASVLAARLAAIAPVARDEDDGGPYAADPRWAGARTFFSESGSVSVEVAIKIALQYHMNRGRHARRRVAYLRNAYHGDTLGTMAVCDPEEGMHAKFAGALPAHGPMVSLPLRHGVGVAPATRGLAAGALAPAESEAVDAAVSQVLEASDSLAALIVEPLVQGAGGFAMYHPEALRRLADACRSRDIVLIADEIMTGLGRVTGADGHLFACGLAGVDADVVTVSKALTGGTCGLAATVASARLFRGFLSESDPEACLMHGPTYAGNPLACAAANASLDLFGVPYPDGAGSATGEPPDVTPRTRFDQVALLEAHFAEALHPLRALPGVRDVRVTGAVGVVQLDGFVTPAASAFLKDRFLRAHGCYVRPFRDVVYVAPPFVLDAEERARLSDAVAHGLGEFAEERSRGRLGV